MTYYLLFTHISNSSGYFMHRYTGDYKGWKINYIWIFTNNIIIGLLLSYNANKHLNQTELLKSSPKQLINYIYLNKLEEMEFVIWPSHSFEITRKNYTEYVVSTHYHVTHHRRRRHYDTQFVTSCGEIFHEWEMMMLQDE